MRYLFLLLALALAHATAADLDNLHPGIQSRLFVFSGTGDLAGGSIVEPGWPGSLQVPVQLQGNDSIYNHQSMHVHIFPVTGK